MIEEKKPQQKKNWLGADVSFGGIGIVQKTMFAKHLALMIKSGVSVTEALKIIADSSDGKFKKIVGEILKSVLTGHTLADSLAVYPSVFSEVFISAVFAGEESGALSDNLEKVANELEKERNLSEKIKGAMFYPLIILASTFILGLALTFFVLPKIVPLFEGMNMDLPWTTRALISSSTFVQENTIALFSVIILGGAFLAWLSRLKAVKPFTHMILLNTPIIRRISRNSNLACFCRTLGMLIKSGVSIVDALAITQKALGNYHYKTALDKISMGVSRGAKLSENLEARADLFPLITTRMIKVGEESGNLEEVLAYLAGFYESEVDSATKTLSNTVEPLLLLFVGAFVGFLTLSIITPIYNITGSMQR